MRTAYVTDSFSNLAGLAAVAYNNVENFREVQNQVISQSSTAFLDRQRPSDALQSYTEILPETVVSGIKTAYNTNEQIKDFFQSNFGADWESKISKIVSTVLPRVLDSGATYGATLTQQLTKVLESFLPEQFISDSLNKIKSAIESEGTLADVEMVFKGISNSPFTKLDSPPPDTIINLLNSVSLGIDWKGLDFTKAYLTLKDYYSDKPYPTYDMSRGIGDISELIDSIKQGYVGYSASNLLESVFNPAGAESVSTASQSPADGSTQPSPTSVLGQLYELTRQTDAEVYDISLIGPIINGYFTYNEKTMSEGDFIDSSKVVDFTALNIDPEKGKIDITREFDLANQGI